MFKQMALSIAVALSLPAQAITVAQWDFNSSPSDANLTTGTAVPSVGQGSAGLFGFTSFRYDSGLGSSDPDPIDNTAWLTRPYPAQGAGNRSAGVQFASSTVGYKDILLRLDQRYASNASKYFMVTYTVDGSTFLDAPGGLLSATQGGGVWYSRSVDFAGLAGVDSNSKFAVRIVSIFAPGTLAYEAASAGSSYGETGPMTYDMVSITANPVPEPESFALMAAGLVALGMMVWMGKVRHI